MIDVKPYLDKLSVIPEWIEVVAQCKIEDELMFSGGIRFDNLTMLFRSAVIIHETIGFAASIRTIHDGYPSFINYFKSKHLTP